MAADPYPAIGFPRWYQDNGGTRVEPCLDAADPNCIVLADPNFDPALPEVFPTNFPGEFFYQIADSDPRLATPGCWAAGIGPGTASVRAAVEGTFVNGVPVAGEEIIFGRIRLAASGLCPNTEYLFTHPYGTERVVTNGAGAVSNNEGTQDVGCLAAPCDFSLPLRSRVLGGARAATLRVDHSGAAHLRPPALASPRAGRRFLRGAGLEE